MQIDNASFLSSTKRKSNGRRICEALVSCSRLRHYGYNVAIVQNPTISLADDVALTKRTISALMGPITQGAILMAVRLLPKPVTIQT